VIHLDDPARLLAVSGLSRLHPLMIEIADDDVPDNILVVHHENARPLVIALMGIGVRERGRCGHAGIQPKERCCPRARGSLKVAYNKDKRHIATSRRRCAASISPFVRFSEAIVADPRVRSDDVVASPRWRCSEVPQATWRH